MEQLLAVPARRSERIEAPELPEYVNRNLDLYRLRVECAWRGEVHFLKSAPPPAGAIDLGSNDYLRLAQHPEIIRAKVEALQGGGGDTLMSAVFLEADSVHHRFERAMAEHLGCAETILCQSGYAANIGLLQTLTTERTPVYIDLLAHMSLWDGARYAPAPAQSFRHNDVEHLQRKIRQHGPGVVVVDSVYSTDGSVCPLHEVVELARRYECTLLVDESHALGTHGARGEGRVGELGLESEVAFRTASLSKAFCDRGGIVACPERFGEYFRTHAHPAVFSSAVMTYQAAGFLETLRVIREDGWRRERLHHNARLLRAGLDALGYNVDASRSQIMALESGSDYRTIFLRDLLATRGVVGAPFVSPATSLERGIVRLTAHCDLTPEEIDRVLEVCADVRKTAEVENWRSTRRKHGPSRVGPVFTRASEARPRPARNAGGAVR